MFNENKIKNIENLFNLNNQVMTTSELLDAKFYYADIKELLDAGFIEKIRQGYYHRIKNGEAREILIINKLFPDAVLCMETALFYYEYIDRNPLEWNFAIDKNVSKFRTKIDYPFIKPYRVESALLTLGEAVGEIDYTKVRIYDRDRTICDVLKNMHKMDKEIFNKAIQGYVNDSKKNIPNLIKYAEKLRVSKKVKDIISIWL